MVHVTCLAHGLHRVSELVRESYPSVNRLISTTKNVFVKSPYRIRAFIAPEIPLPHSPLLTIWGTWLDAAYYYAKHLEKVCEVVMSFDNSEAQCIDESQKIIVELSTSVTFVSSTFSILSKTTKTLETRGLSLSVFLELIEEVEKALDGMYDQRFSHKLSSVLSENGGFQTLKIVNNALQGSVSPLDAEVQDGVILSAAKFLCYKYAPVVSCDVEMMFSEYKTVFADNRRSFNFENLKAHMIIKCNN